MASLDPLARRDFLRELVGQVLERSTTVVFSTHILSDLERVAFNVAFLKAGRIALQAPLDELLERTRLIVGRYGESDAQTDAQIDAVPGLQLLDRQGGRSLVRFLDRDASQSILPTDLVVQRASLEDLFEVLT